MFGRRVLLLGVVLADLACAEPLQFLARAPTAGVSPYSYWPPAASSATWVARTGAHRQLPMNSVATELELGLRAAGYADQRWYPIGARHAHGFAVTTRLERVDLDWSADAAERWTPLYPEAANLKWLRLARTLPLLRSGRYRVLLIAYTDLPIGMSSIAPVWSEATIMDGPGARESFSADESGVPARPPIGYRFGIYEYEYRWQASEACAALRPADQSVDHQLTRPPARLARVLGDSSTE